MKPGLVDFKRAARGVPSDGHVASADDWRSLLIKRPNGHLEPCLANATTMLRRSPEWRGVLAFDEFARSYVALKRTPWLEREVKRWTDQHTRLTAEWLQNQGVLVSTAVAGEAVATVAMERSFHPVKDHLESITWDGVPRLDTWLTMYARVTHSDYVAAVARRFVISMIARVYKPGCKADCALILEGAQGLGKSSLLRALAEPWFTDEIADLGSKDAALQASGAWLIEIGELSSMRWAEVNAIKVFLSRSTDRFRPPYGRYVEEVPRTCVLSGTTNEHRYLADETGGRRFWPVFCEETLMVDEFRAVRDQIRAEALAAYRAGETWWLDTPELNAAAEAEQSQRYVGGVLDDLVSAYVDGRESVTIGEVLTNAVEKPKDRWTEMDKRAIGKALRSMGWLERRVRVNGARECRWFCPPSTVENSTVDTRWTPLST